MIDKLLSKLTGRQHHFKLVIRYTPDRFVAEHYSERVMTVWVRERRDVADERYIRKAVGAGLVESVPRHRRNNGNVQIRETYYLGWFRPFK